MSNTVPILPINQITYATERGITCAGDVVSHLKTLPVGWSAGDPFWTLGASTKPEAQAKVKALVEAGNFPGNVNILDRIPGKLHMIERPDAHTIFCRESLAHEVPSGVRIFKIAVGPLEVSIALDPHSYGVTLQMYLQAPIVGAISVASVSGDVNNVVKADVAYPKLLSGGGNKTTGVMQLKKISEGSKSYAQLSWDVTVFKKHYEDKFNVFDL